VRANGLIGVNRLSALDRHARAAQGEQPRRGAAGCACIDDRDVVLATITPQTLRHVFATELLNAGANLRELMDRMGHSTTRAALIYLRSTDDRQRTIADLIDKRTRAELRKIKKPSGTKVTRPRKQAS